MARSSESEMKRRSSALFVTKGSMRSKFKFQLEKMFQGARSVCRKAELWPLVALTTALCLFQGHRVTGDPLPSKESSIATVTVHSKTDKNGVIVPNNAKDEDSSLHNELSTLLTELREIAESIDAIRKEHGKLAKGVSDISNAVKDMNEKSEHIKKKVRKMSKALNKNGNHHKLKNSLRNLQKDHQRILQAMLNSSFVHHHKNGSRPMNHRNRTGGQQQQHKHVRNHCSNSTHPACSSIQRNESTKLQHHTSNEVAPVIIATSSTTRSPMTVSPAPLTSKNMTVVPTEKDNTIPEPVVEPQGRTESPKKSVPLPIDCTEVIQMGNMTSGVYRIQPKGLENPIKVWCDHTTQGGGWTMLVARFPQQGAQEDFNRNWEDYKKGFGDPAKEHWIGNEALHAMTDNKRHELRLNITDWKGSIAWAEWKDFNVAGEDKFYALTVGRYASGSSAGDALKWHNGMKFSTPDRDNDALMGGQCAVRNAGGWWYRGYRGCYQAHPTGRYQHEPKEAPKATGKKILDLGPVLAWQNWRGDSFFPKKLFLMFRPVMP